MNKRKAFIPITALLGALLLALVATMTPFVAERDAAYAQAALALTALAVQDNGGTAVSFTDAAGTDVSFSGTTREYRLVVDNTVTGVTVTATSSDNAVVITTNPADKDGDSTNGYQVDLNAGGNKTAITVNLTKSSPASTGQYTINVYRKRQVLSTDNGLSDLKVDGSTVSGFSKSTLRYNLRVDNNKGTIKVLPGLSDAAGGVNVAVTRGTAANARDTTTVSPATDGSYAVALESATANAGSMTYVRVAVTAEDGSAAQNYDLNVYRKRVNTSTDAALASSAGLTISGGGATLSPTYAAGTKVYSARIESGQTLATNEVTVGVAAADGGATWRFTSPSAGSITHTATDGVVDGGTITLNGQGQHTTISVEVTAEDGETKETYTIKLYRENETPSPDNDLSGLMVDGSQVPNFKKDTSAYNKTVANSVSKVNVKPTASHIGAAIVVTADSDNDVTPKNDGSYEIDLNDAGVTTGSTSVITVAVTSESGVARSPSYTISVYRMRLLAHANAKLADSGGLTISGGNASLSPSYDSGENNYTARIESAQSAAATTVTIGVSTADNGATWRFTKPGANMVSRTATGGTITLNDPGKETVISVEVTAEDGETKETYTIKLYRENVNPSDDKDLTALSVNGVSVTDFDKDTGEYDVRVESGVDKAKVKAALSHIGAAVAVTHGTTSNGRTGNSVTADADGSYEISLGAERSTTYIRVAVTPEDGTAAKNYDIDVYRKSSNPAAVAKLSALTVTPAEGAAVTLLPAFNVTDDHKAYRAIVDYSTETNSLSNKFVTLAATAVGNGEVGYSLGDAVSHIDGRQIMLTAGASTPVTITVTAEDEETKQEYTLSIYRKNSDPSKDAELSAFKLMEGDEEVVLSPTFTPGNLKYKADSSFSSDTLALTFTPSDDAGGVVTSVMVGGVAVSESDGSYPIKLNAAGLKTTISVAVTPEAGATPASNVKTYTVEVTREATASTDATLKSLGLTDTDGTVVALMDAEGNAIDFVGTTPAYHARVADDTVMVAAEANHNAATVSADDLGDKSLDVGDNTITVTVTAEDGTTTMDYTVTVRRLSSDATLSSMGLELPDDGGVIDLSPDFMTTTTEYAAMVGHDVKSVVLTWSLGHSSSTLGYEGLDNLSVGDNTITATVTAEDGTTTMDYTITVTRAKSPDATLSALSLMGSDGVAIALTANVAEHWNSLSCEEMIARVGADAPADGETSPYCAMYADLGEDAKAVVDAKYAEDPIGFMSDLNNYSASMDYDAGAAVKLMAKAAHEDATVAVMHGADDTADTDAMADEDGNFDVPLSEGKNTIKVTVTAADGVATEYYMVVATRGSLSDEERLLRAYDADGDRELSDSELGNAIVDYTMDVITGEQMGTIILIYVFGIDGIEGN